MRKGDIAEVMVHIKHYRITRRLMAIGSALSAAIVLIGCGTGTSESGVNENAFASVTRVSNPGAFFFPTSAVPDAAGQFIYFVASGPTGRGIFRVPATGGNATEVFVGAPFVLPTDIALSTDNQTLFIADQEAGGSGRIYTLPVAGGNPTELPGTAGTMPRALDVIRQGGQDKVYFCGREAGDGESTVFEIAAAGGQAATLRHKGAPLSAAGGIIAAADGTLYIADRGSQPDQGGVYRLSGTTMTRLGGNIFTGQPPGIALTPDNRTVVVSSLHPTNGTAQVVLIDVQTGSTSVFNRVIGSNINAGGLHPARNASGATGTYAWVDGGDGSGGGGGIYRLR